jgi:hypothetical protein
MSLAEDLDDMFADRNENDREFPPEKEEIIMKRYPLVFGWYQEIWTMDLGVSKKNLAVNYYQDMKTTLRSGITYRRIVCCGRPFKKNKHIWDSSDVTAQRDHFQLEYNYDLYEDVHQMANFCEI